MQTKAKNLLTIIATAIMLLWPGSATALVTKSRIPNYNSVEYLEGLNENLDLRLHKNDFVINIEKDDLELRMAINASSLAKPGQFPQSYQVKIYTIGDDEEENYISSITNTLLNNKQSTNSAFRVDLRDIDTSQDLYFDVYNSSGTLMATFKQYVEFENVTTQSNIRTDVASATCEDDVFGDCHLRYLLENIKFEAVPSKTPTTKILKRDNGKYTVKIPSMRIRQRAGRKVSRKGGSGDVEDFDDGGITRNIDLGVNFQDKATINYDEGDLNFTFPGMDENVLTVNEMGHVGVGITETTSFFDLRGGNELYPSIRINTGTLTTQLIDGAIEYDGNNLYFTSNGQRQAIAFGQGAIGPAGPQGPIGPQGPTGPAGSISNNGSLQNLTVTNTFTFTNGATNGYVLTSDANGNATWQDMGSFVVNGDNLGNHIASMDLNMNSHSINNATIEAGMFNGLSLFKNGHTAKFNGMVMITNGASANRVLTSDASGYATWQSLSSLPGNGDDLGNHTATTNLNMGGNNITNANSITATSFTGDGSNLTNINSTTLGGLDSSKFLQNGNNLSELENASTARTNLGLAIGTDVQAYHANLTTWSGKTAPSGTVVGDTDTQTLSNKTLEQAILNGFTLFSDNSAAQFNGTVMITSGSPGSGKVLTSDSQGNATWTDPSSLASNGDDLGNHTATTNLNMGGNNITNANSITATSFTGDGSNLTNINSTTLDGLDSSKFLQNGNNLSELENASTARTNLGLAIGTDVQAYHANLTTWSGKTAPSGTVIGDTDTQTLSNKTLEQAIHNGFTLFSDNSAAQFNGTVMITSGSPGSGKVLTSDAQGNATWQSPGSGADHLGNHTATENLDLANFDIVNATMQAGNFNGFSLFNANSSAQFNGTVMITSGSPGSGKVLTSDAQGNATWQSPGSGADHLGNHTATENLDLANFDIVNATMQAGNFNGFSLFNANSSAQFNGTVMITSGSPGNNKVLTSDAQGNATWQSLSSLPSNGDDLGNHTATTNLNMGGNNITNANSITATSFSGDGSSLTNINSTTLDGLDSSKFLQNGNNLSELENASTARTNLGLAIGTDVQAYHANLTTWSGKTAPSGTVVGDTDSQTLSNKTLEQAILNGFTLFSDNSAAQFNGTVMITSGSPGNNKVLTSDAQGNATWQSLSSLPSNGDDLGNHTATTNLNMGGNNITNANSITATSFSGDGSSLTNINSTTLDGLDSSKFLQNGNNLSELENASTARTNLGLAIGTDVQAYHANLTTWSGKTAPSGTVVGDTDSQTLSNKTLEQAILNGFTLFSDNSAAQFNGTVMITSGSPGNNKVLTSDAQGNATWQSLSSLPSNGDDLGNHTATTNLNLGGNNITNANSITATSFSGDGSSLTNINSTTLDGLDSSKFLQNGNNLSELENASTARTNLGLAIGTDVQAYHANLTTWSGKTAPSGTVVGDTDSQTLSNKTLEQAILNGFTLFSDNSAAQFNGTIMITSGSPGAGKVLTSDAQGNATWQSSGGGSDDLGNHTATQNLDLASNDIVNATIQAGQFNGTSLFKNNSKAQFNGTVMITSGSPGAGKVLTSDAQGNASWTATTGLSGVNADTLDGLDSAQFLRSDTSDQYTSGTLTLNSSTELNAASGSTVDIDGALEIADTDISLDGASTTFTQTTGAISFAPASAANFNINLSGNGDFTVATNLLYGDTSNASLGINTSNPSTTLEVNGSIMAGTLIVTDAVYPETQAATTTVDWNNGNRQKVTLNGSVTNLNFTNPSSGVGHFSLILIQDGTGSRTITNWDSDVRWPGGTAPTLSTIPNSIDVVSCLYDDDGPGSAPVYYCQIGIDFQ